MNIIKLCFGCIIFSILFSCSQDDECSPPISEYDIIDIVSQVSKSSTIPDGITPLSTSILSTGESVDWNEFVIELTSIKHFLSSIDKDRPRSFDLSLISKAYACSGIPPFTKEKIASINIISNYDYSAALPAGSSLNEVFDVVWNNLEFRRNSNTGEIIPYNLDEFNELTPTAGNLIQVRLNQAPTLSFNHEFIIEYTHVDGESFSLLTPLVTFN